MPPDDRTAQLQHGELQVGREVVTPDPIRIILVGMVRLHRDDLAKALSTQPDLEIVGEFDDVDSALEAEFYYPQRSERSAQPSGQASSEGKHVFIISYSCKHPSGRHCRCAKHCGGRSLRPQGGRKRPGASGRRTLPYLQRYFIASAPRPA
jgi:hypothetical protein